MSTDDREAKVAVGGTAAVDEQAAHWCLRLAEATLQPAEQGEFDRWIADARHRRAFEEAVAIWREVESVADEPELLQMRSHALESLRRVNRRRWAGNWSARWRWPSVAAAVVAIAALTVFLTIRQETQVLETGTAERRIVRLADGSQLSLDAGSRVEVRLARHRRDLRLTSGRARFDVARDPLRPFDVAVGDKVVVALGTSFSVELVQQQLRVVLYEGRVQVLQRPSGSVSRPAEDRELTPGHELWSTVGRQDATVMTADVPRSVSWESGQLSFVNEPLGLAVERVNRYSQTKLVVADAAAAAITVNGVFNAGDINAFVEGLKSFTPITVTEGSGRLLINGQPVAEK